MSAIRYPCLIVGRCPSNFEGRNTYIMDSETAIDRGYGDLSLILRPDMRRYQLLDHLLEVQAPALGGTG
uniref:Uncharacterized protein n=2 Tax=Candidatus Kentrum sp. FM TaxID=2126340 RepID=A0A450W089_9GAMM|nr:MAG: hypothetical protein BECKFM1743A_GA0114220_101333 [Candidatus Kentron sp. FM]VFK10463.1 MAG: hypothetical protein BECKFM1743B_GA0114221_101413 [Candidatus Kentron sp. FM]